MKTAFLSLLAFGLIGCASATPQTDAYLQGLPNLIPSFEIQNVPFVDQSVGHCGPATLAMAMNWSGKKISVEDLAPQVYTPGMKGSLQSDLISASRRNGMLAIPISGLDALLVEVAAGHPVIVFENLALSWLPQWHYAIVFGYDLPKQTVTMHSGPEAFKHWDLRKFERSWKLGNYWGLVVLPPDQLAASEGEFAHSKAAAALENIGKWEEARKAYQRIRSRWPKSLLAHIGLANIAFTQKDNVKSMYFLQHATADHPQSAIAWHNLAIVQGAMGKIADARRSAHQALLLVSPSERSVYLENLKIWNP